MKDSTDITVILDRSGSMECIREATIEGFNTFVAEQQKVTSESKMTLIQFDHEIEVFFKEMRVQEVRNMSHATFVPRGSTALLDAIGRTVVAMGERFAKLPESERPARVVLTIMTDGEENASEEYKQDQIDKMLSHQREAYNWQVIFLGANQDAIKTATSLGINVANAMTYAGNAQGAQSALRSMSMNVAAYSMSVSNDASFSAAQRQEQGDLLTSANKSFGQLSSS